MVGSGKSSGSPLSSSCYFQVAKIGWRGAGAGAQGLARQASSWVTLTFLLWASGSPSIKWEPKSLLHGLQRDKIKYIKHLGILVNISSPSLSLSLPLFPILLPFALLQKGLLIISEKPEKQTFSFNRD